jgi:hypothetical protein
MSLEFSGDIWTWRDPALSYQAENLSEGDTVKITLEVGDFKRRKS